MGCGGHRRPRSKVADTVAALADLALRRPGALLAGNLAVLALAVILAVGSARVGSASVCRRWPGDGGARADLVVATRGPTPVHSGPYRVALRVISAQLQLRLRRSRRCARARSPPIGDSTSLVATLVSGDDADRQRAVERIEREIDPGPLRVSYGGEVATLLEARHDLSDYLWKLGLAWSSPWRWRWVRWPWGRGWRSRRCSAPRPQSPGALAGLRLAGELADVSLLGIAPAAVLGSPWASKRRACWWRAFATRPHRRSDDEALRRALAAAGEAALPLALGAIAATAGLAGHRPRPGAVDGARLRAGRRPGPRARRWSAFPRCWRCPSVALSAAPSRARGSRRLPGPHAPWPGTWPVRRLTRRSRRPWRRR